jgi:adenosylcobinamide kinase / adenosylcobinamide-phosphate guanylyltransferase
MRITLVTGGARSGKSSYAQQLAERLGGDAVTVVATARADDDDMLQRIARHRINRSAAWEVIEAPIDVRAAITAARHDVVFLDCMTVLSANVMLGGTERSSLAAEDAIVGQASAVIEAAAARQGTLIIVTNEVGSSIHPPTELGRWYQDALGKANALIAGHAMDAVLMVCGMPLVLKGSLPSV